jgi:hypothetical protein
VRLTRYRPQNSQSLGGNLNTVLPKEISGVSGHGDMLDQIIE